MRDSVSIRAQLVEILGADVGPAVADQVIASAFSEYDFRPIWPRKRRPGHPIYTKRENLAISVAHILERLGVRLPKTRGGDLDKVLRVVFKAVGEPSPVDMFDIIKIAIEQVEF